LRISIQNPDVFEILKTGAGGETSRQVSDDDPLNVPHNTISISDGSKIDRNIIAFKPLAIHFETVM
jgi:hypothetical protein